LKQNPQYIQPSWPLIGSISSEPEKEWQYQRSKIPDIYSEGGGGGKKLPIKKKRKGLFFFGAMYKKYINGKKKNYNIFFKNCKECV
jgi:hypothetical protein